MSHHSYSSLFSCLYDETAPIGNLGRGTHYSVFRCVEWLDVIRRPLELPEIHDFAIVWDEDHDLRIIKMVEALYLNGLLSPVQFIGERKGILHIVVAANFYWSCGQNTIDKYIDAVHEVSESGIVNDAWPADIGAFDRSYDSSHQIKLPGLIHAPEERVITYLRNIDSLWSLGTKPFLKVFPELDSDI